MNDPTAATRVTDASHVARPTRAAPTNESRQLARSTSAITLFTGVSRLTGFVRVMVVVAVLGTTTLGNTYESANNIPNILYELFAAGVLQAVLIPTLVGLFDSEDDEDAEHVASSVLGFSCVLMAALAAVGMLAAPLVARGLFSGVSDPHTRAAQVHLGTVFLWFFLPQVIFYAAGTVATGVLNARHRFAVPAAAPIVNNVVVMACYGGFALLRGHKAPSLHLSPPEVLVLAGGTTLGVILFCGFPVLAARRGGFRLTLRFDRHHPAVRRIGRLGIWAAVYLAAENVLLAVVLVLANREPGGVVAYQAAITYFLLPHALVAESVITALFPSMARQMQRDDWTEFGRSMARGTRAIAFFVMPAAAALFALGPVIGRTLFFGHVGHSGAVLLGRTISAFAPGLVGYGMFLFGSRIFYAHHDTRTPAAIYLGVVVGGAALMVVAFFAVSDPWRVPALALSYAIAYTLGAIVMLRSALRRLPIGGRPRFASPVLRATFAAVVAGVVMWGVTTAIGVPGRVGGLIELAVAAFVGGLVYLGLEVLVGGPRPARMLALLRSGRRGEL